MKLLNINTYRKPSVLLLLFLLAFAVLAVGVLNFKNDDKQKPVSFSQTTGILSYSSKMLDFQYPANFKVTNVRDDESFFDIQFSEDGDYQKAYMGVTVNDLSGLNDPSRILPKNTGSYPYWETNSGGEKVYDKTFKKIKINGVDGFMVTGKYKESKFDKDGNYKGVGEEKKFEVAEAYVNNKDVRFFAKAKTPNKYFFNLFEEIVIAAKLK